ncbi:MAG: DUF58 domain-containing protein [Deltaproteobacteria bacterium]|nr:DUF58 domain-containing protein [Deltaproteobacteria bacterium]
MISRELIKKIRLIHLKTRRQVTSVFAGQYESAFRGQGMEFEEVREYIEGDDIRSIDWNVTARMNRPYIKVFREEREMTVMLLVDVSSSERFGTARTLKMDMAAETAAILAYAAIRNNDKVGLIIFSDTVEKYIPPKKGVGHIFRVIKEVLDYRPTGHGTSLDEGLKFLIRVTRRKAVCFLISDFFDTGFERSLRIAAKKHDLVALVISDPKETLLPPLGYVTLVDAETGRSLTVNTSAPGFHKQFQAVAEKRTGGLVNLFRRAGVDHTFLPTPISPIDPLLKFFIKREKKFR